MPMCDHCKLVESAHKVLASDNEVYWWCTGCFEELFEESHHTDLTHEMIFDEVEDPYGFYNGRSIHVR